VPLQPRARSKSSQHNDALILDAGVAEALEFGLDRIALRSVVRRCGLTSGAIYSRYEDADDFVAALWTERLRQPTFDLMSAAMAAMLTDEVGPGLAEVTRQLTSPTPEVSLGCEALIVGRRNDVLGEEISDEFSSWAEKWGLHASAQPDQRVLASVAFATIAGAAIYSFAEPGLTNWESVFSLISSALRTTNPADKRPSNNLEIELPNVVHHFEVQPGTGEPLRDALIVATANVIGRAGYERTTVSRIGRRAKLTGGAVYTRYETKDQLIIDTLGTLLNGAIAGTQEVTEWGTISGEVPEALNRVYHLGVTPSRRAWRQFRLETYLAARTRTEPRDALRTLHASGAPRYKHLISRDHNVDDVIVDLLARGGQSLPLGLSLLECFETQLEMLDFSAYTQSLYNALRDIA
jgi:AcrR family transcriptional regulator